jgi:Cu(I)/Ag(I) efflux system membrane fusion protein
MRRPKPGIDMKRSLSIVLFIALAFLVGYGYGRWYARDPVAVAAKTTQPVLYYRCPMHPSFRSDKPGVSTCCNMKLQPVYAGDADATSRDEPAGVLRITPQQQQLIGIEYGSVEYGRVSRALHGVARVVVNETRVARVQTKLEGWVDQIQVNSVGTVVKRGQVLLTIYNPKSQLAQQEYLQAMDASGVDMNSPEYTAAHARNKIVNREGQLAGARLQLQLLGFSDSQIETVGKAHQAMVRLPVQSPINGTVVEYNLQPRQKVSPDTLYTIADLSTVWVIADFLASDAPSIQPGQAASLTVPYLPGRVFRGTVDTILPQLDPGTRSLKVRFQFDNPDQSLRIEMFGEVELRIAGIGRKLTVPQEAVLDSGRRQTVFIDLGDGYVESREVKTGDRFGDRVEILKGLQAGQRVVTSGNFLLDSESQLRQRH